MKNKLLITLMFGLLLISFASAQLEELGCGKQNDNFTIIQTCSDASYITLSTIQYPDKTIKIVNSNMTYLGSGSFAYNFSQTSQLGRYDITGISNGCENTFGYYFEITYNGECLTLQKSILNLGFLLLIAFLFVLSVYGFLAIGNNEVRGDKGEILSLDSLKYFKGTLFLIAYGLLMGLFFTASNVAYAYLSTDMFGKILFTIFKIFNLVLYPLVVVWLIWLFVNIFQDKETKNMLERGVQIGDI